MTAQMIRETCELDGSEQVESDQEYRIKIFLELLLWQLLEQSE
jgi:hypothetical protein